MSSLFSAYLSDEEDETKNNNNATNSPPKKTTTSHSTTKNHVNNISNAFKGGALPRIGASTTANGATATSPADRTNQMSRPAAVELQAKRSPATPQNKNPTKSEAAAQNLGLFQQYGEETDDTVSTKEGGMETSNSFLHPTKSSGMAGNTAVSISAAGIRGKSSTAPPEKSLSFNDIVSKLNLMEEYGETKGKDTSGSNKTGDASPSKEFTREVLYDSDDEELAELQQKDTNTLSKLQQQQSSDSLTKDLSNQSGTESKSLKRKRVDLQTLENQLKQTTSNTEQESLHEEPARKKQRLAESAPKLPEFVSASRQQELDQKKLDEIPDEEEDFSQSEEEFELDEAAYELPPEVQQESKSAILPSTSITTQQNLVPEIQPSSSSESIDQMNIPDHIKAELRNRNVKEITADDILAERELSRQKRLRDYHERSIHEKEMETANHQMQMTAGNLVGHDMMKLARETIQSDLKGAKRGKKGKRR